MCFGGYGIGAGGWYSLQKRPSHFCTALTHLHNTRSLLDQSADSTMPPPMANPALNGSNPVTFPNSPNTANTHSDPFIFGFNPFRL